MENKEHEYCLRCGRRLKNIEARKIGYGQVCLKKLKVTEAHPLFASAHHLQSQQKEKLP